MVDKIKYSHKCENIENVYSISIYHTEDTANTITCEDCGVELRYCLLFPDEQVTYPSFDGTTYKYDEGDL